MNDLPKVNHRCCAEQVGKGRQVNSLHLFSTINAWRAGRPWDVTKVISMEHNLYFVIKFMFNLSNTERTVPKQGADILL